MNKHNLTCDNRSVSQSVIDCIERTTAEGRKPTLSPAAMVAMDGFQLSKPKKSRHKRPSNMAANSVEARAQSIAKRILSTHQPGLALDAKQGSLQRTVNLSEDALELFPDLRGYSINRHTLGQDASLADVHALLDSCTEKKSAMDDNEMDIDNNPVMDDDEMIEQIMSKLRGNMSASECAEIESMLRAGSPAMDAPPSNKTGYPVMPTSDANYKTAMDAFPYLARSYVSPKLAEASGSTASSNIYSAFPDLN